MFPIGDDDSSRRTFPIVTYALIALNLLLFFVELSGGDPFIEHWSVIPRAPARESRRRFSDDLHLDVHACRLVTPRRQYALPLRYGAFETFDAPKISLLECRLWPGRF